MALLEYEKNGRRTYECGGSLITKRYVMTAAHCILGVPVVEGNYKLVSIRLGEWNTKIDPDCTTATSCSDKPIDVPIDEYKTHEDYNPYSKNNLNDIALVRLSTEVTFTEWIKPLCLPLTELLKTKIYDGLTLVVSGWGLTEKGIKSDVKLKVNVDGFNSGSCDNLYRSANARVTNKHICAGGSDKGFDSCRGDSGGPLMTLDTTNRLRPYWYAVGIVSFGPTPCGRTGAPGVYTRVSEFTGWIIQNIKP